jgi:hypothetical protein
MNNIYIKYCFLLLIPLIENACSFNLISPFFGLTVHKRIVNKPIKMCSIGLSFGQSNSSTSPYRAGTSNPNLNIKNNKIDNKLIDEHTNNLQNLTLSSDNIELNNILLKNLYKIMDIN